MRKPTLSLLGLVALLMGADGTTLTVLDLPGCEPNTYLVYRKGKIVCEPALPDCKGQLLHAGSGGDLSGLSCIAKIDDALTNAELQRIVDLQTQTKKLVEQFDALGIQPALSASFVGITVATTRGRIEYPGAAAGLGAANARCAFEYGAGTHLCAAREMLGGVFNATLEPDKDVPNAWLYMPTWNILGGELPFSGLGDNCGGYTNSTTDRGWAGMAVNWSLGPHGNRILHFIGGAMAACDQALPLACCR